MGRRLDCAIQNFRPARDQVSEPQRLPTTIVATQCAPLAAMPLSGIASAGAAVYPEDGAERTKRLVLQC